MEDDDAIPLPAHQEKSLEEQGAYCFVQRERFEHDALGFVGYDSDGLSKLIEVACTYVESRTGSLNVHCAILELFAGGY
ncbi:hypothetical protein QQ045_008863 [Rhodiola kirilowii]